MGNKDRRFKARFQAKVKLRLIAQLIGNNQRYQYHTENISASGLLIHHEGKKSSTFNSHSILEVWLEIAEETHVFFLAKYVRKASQHSFAIKIVDIDKKNEEMYRSFLDHLATHLDPARIAAR